MTVYTVKTQTELDATLTKATAYDTVLIDSPAGVRITVTGTTVASGSSTVRAYGSSTVVASGSSTVEASGSSTVRAYGSSTVVASGSSTVRASGSSTVEASGSSTVRAYGSSTVRAFDSSTVVASGSSTVEASGSSTVVASGSSTVRAFDSSTVRASGSSTVRAYGSSTVRAFDSSTVVASSHTAVHLHSGRAIITGGVLIDHTTIDLTNVTDWAAYTGATVAGDTLTLYKAVDADLNAGHSYKLTAYPIGGTVTCPDWRDNNDCGAGLHFSPTPGQAEVYYSGPGRPRFLEVTVSAGTFRPIPGGTAKGKASSCTVVREVDVHARPVVVAAVTA